MNALKIAYKAFIVIGPILAGRWLRMGVRKCQKTQ